MKLIDLQPQFLKLISANEHKYVDTVHEADGIQFDCPKCHADDKKGHTIICWQPHVPQNIFPHPGRWYLVGTCYGDLTLKSSPSLVQLQNGCHAHFFIRDGFIIPQ